jgi:hypothetical protein
MSDAQREACGLSLSNKYTPSTISKAQFRPSVQNMVSPDLQDKTKMLRLVLQLLLLAAGAKETRIHLHGCIQSQGEKYHLYQ